MRGLLKKSVSGKGGQLTQKSMVGGLIPGPRKTSMPCGDCYNLVARAARARAGYRKKRGPESGAKRSKTCGLPRNSDFPGQGFGLGFSLSYRAFGPLQGVPRVLFVVPGLWPSTGGYFPGGRRIKFVDIYVLPGGRRINLTMFYGVSGVMAE